jgi:hypothetical protein
MPMSGILVAILSQSLDRFVACRAYVPVLTSPDRCVRRRPRNIQLTCLSLPAMACLA